MTPDSSALIAAFAPWHERHDAARVALRGLDDLVAHAELEAYSVLMRLPAPFRAPREVVAEYLRRRYPGRRLVIGARRRRELVPRLASAGIAGSAVYDALIAVTASDNGSELVSCDRRAAPVYEAMGAAVKLL